MAIDFLLRQGGKVMPVAVKTLNNSCIKSLSKFREKFGGCAGEIVVLHDGDIQNKDGI